MRNVATISILTTLFALGACGVQNQANTVDLSGDRDMKAAADAEAALDNAAAMIENAEAEITAAPPPAPPPAPVSSVPSYSSTAYCQTIGETAGGSSVIESTCRDMEADALRAIRARSIPARVHRYCNNIGQTAGGSYVIYNTCVDMELQAAGSL